MKDKMLEALDIYELKLRKSVLMIIMGFDIIVTIEYMFLIENEVSIPYFI